MPKRVFWPLAFVVMGLLFLAAVLGMMPREFWNFWPLIFIIVGLGGLVTSDKEEWDGQPKPTVRSKSSSTRKTASNKKKAVKKTSKKSTKKSKK